MKTPSETVRIEFVEELKEQWLAMIDALNDSLAIIDSDFTIHRYNRTYFNKALSPQKTTIQELRGRKCYEAFADRTSPCPHCKLPNALSENRSFNWTTTDLHPEARVEIEVHPLQQAKYQSKSLAVVHYSDVTQIHSMQESLAQADKLTALGKLAGGVAHEINSPLAGILAFAQMALKEMSPEDPHRQDMLEIEDAALKCKSIVEGLLGFARQDKPTDNVPTDVFDAIRSTLRLATPILKKNHIELELNLPEEKALIVGSSGKLGQVFLNLITNAIYSMRSGGGHLAIRATLQPDVVSISVSDTGSGIDASILGKIFDPFFTTKPIGEGTGLGLSITYSIVKQHGGDIKVTSAVGIGTTFIVTFPRLDQST